MSIGMGMGLRAANGNSAALLSSAPSLNLDFIQQRYFMSMLGKNFADLIAFSRASSATRLNASGVLETVASNVPRIDYDPVTLACKGLLIEEQRTNLLAASTGIILTGNVNNGRVLSTDVPPLNAGSSVSKLTFLYSGDSNIGSLSATVSAGNNCTGSVYIWIPGSSSITALELIGEGGAGFSGSVAANLSMRDQWQRISLSTLSTLTGYGSYILRSTGPAGVGAVVYCTCPQFEIGAFATSYIPTTTAQATRAADVATINTLAPWFSSQEGTLAAVLDIVAAVPAATYPGLYTFEGSAIANRIGALISPQQTISAVRRKSGSADVYAGTTAGVAPNLQIKFAQAWSAASQVTALNGAAASATIPWDGIPAGLIKLRLGIFDTALNGHLRSIKYFPKRLTNAQIQALTA